MDKEAYQQQPQRLFLIGLATVMDEWMDAIKCSNVESWNVALATWLVVSSNEHMDTVEDDDGLDKLDGMQTRLISLTREDLPPWMILQHSSQCMQQLLLQSWMKML
ncbi:predicted protein [Lichtheimia corymbifera JMRC:FSU:9682]|uniref:Uncharacterized protein n=1 Tax=Lichtheimia corymbifera JMRC:FSU:9682 TaxID=1263082 RepID=A0A068SFX5_9FUNG|nr:predicted protein [Lichtheimia corymbifera JMRC:FSU:9682]